MPKTSLLLVIPALLLAALPAAAQQRDPAAVEIAQKLMDAMGGLDAWNNTRYVRFDFKVSDGAEVRVNRHHLWDKWEGRYRLEQKLEDGKTRVVLFNTNTQQGDAYLDGEKLDDAEAVEGAYSAFINDTYWLAMPWKWLDPGVNLKSLGEKEHDGKTYDVVELTFDNVGLTPGDTYHAYVDKDSGLMTYWEYTLQSGRTGAWNWEYGTFKGIKLATNHTNEEGRSIHMGEAAVFQELEDAYFSDPAKSIVGMR